MALYRCALIVCAWLLTCAPSALAQRENIEENRMNYHRLLRDSVIYQERKFRISYERHWPRLIFNRIKDNGDYSVHAIYETGSNRIIVQPRFLVCDPYRFFTESEDRRGFCDRVNPRYVLSHEAGHYFLALMVRKYARYGWMRIAWKKTYPEEFDLGLLMVIEGTGEYMGTVWDGAQPTWDDSRLRGFVSHRQFELSGIALAYTGGYSLVKPILDVNVERGFQCLVTNRLSLPTNAGGYDLNNLLLYQKKMVECAKH